MLREDRDSIEAHYRRSAFIEDICVFPRTDGGQGLQALVLPDVARLRTKRIVNVGDLLRFEMDGRAVDLPMASRVVDYAVTFAPLPTTPSGSVDRVEIERRAREHDRRGADRLLTVEEREWLADPHAGAVAEAVRVRARTPHPVGPEANLEIDLGIDSLDRVELVAALEQRCGMTIAVEAAHEIFTLRQLADALRPRSDGADGSEDPPLRGRADEPPGEGPRFSEAEPAAVAGPMWSTVFTSLPSRSDPVLGRLLGRKRLLIPLLFLLYRAWRCVVRIDVAGLEHVPRGEAFILAPNHQSYLDPFFISSVLPYRTFRRLFLLGATEYFETPLMGWLAGALNIVPVDPDANLVGAMQAAAFGLRHGKILLVFPEGERSIDGQVKRFKKGAAILASHLDVPIVPVAITGAFEVWPRGRSLDWRRLGFWNRHRVRIRFGPPLLPNPSSDYAAGARTVRDAVAALRD